MDELSASFESVRAVWRSADWPGVVESLSYGTPALKVRGKLLVRIREPGVLVLLCEMDEKEFLMQSAPEIYYQIDHYKGYPAVLVRLDVIEPDELRERIEKTWMSHATKKMLDEYWSRELKFPGISDV